MWKDEVCTEIDHGGLSGSERTLRPLCKQEQTVSISVLPQGFYQFPKSACTDGPTCLFIEMLWRLYSS